MANQAALRQGKNLRKAVCLSCFRLNEGWLSPPRSD